LNTRNVVSRHYHEERFRSCPVCQHVIDVDHDAALEVHKYMLGFELIEVVEPLDTDLVSEADPDETLPPTS
jgi:hypothetical protein